MFDGEMKGIPTLSFVGQLNDDFVGGEFVMWKDQVIEMHKGTVIVFPSVFLYPHRVDAVKSGTRYSFVSWAY
jgi:predicted 2-oxoglutarate/Fe(II)-dependent dioxygenase YbiX